MKIKLNTIQDLYDFFDIANKVETTIMVKRDNYIVPVATIMGLFVLDMTKEIELVDTDCNPIDVPQLTQYKV